MPGRESSSVDSRAPRLEGRGFLLMTDKYPTTLLAFVPYEENP